MAVRTVLVIEDDPGDAVLLRRALEFESDIDLVFASRLEEGLDRLGREEYDAVLLDLMLPESQGLETLARVLDRTDQVPVVVLTGLSDRSIGIDAVRQGAQDYLIKSELQGRWIARSLDHAIERHRLRRILSQREQDLRRANEGLEQRVAERTTELVALNVQLQAEVIERQRAEAEVRAKNRDLETLLHIASHDLREPLRAIQRFGEMLDLRNRQCLDEAGQDYLRRMRRGADRLDHLLDDILTIARLQVMEKPVGEVAGEELVGDVLVNLEGAIAAAGARVAVIRPLPRFRVNRFWAGQAVFNLVANALKFTREQASPEVEIAPYWCHEPLGTLAMEGGNVEPMEIGHAEPIEGGDGLIVRDRGPGVPQDQAERIFELFRRGVGRDVPGSGAGLAITRQVAEQHGGRAWVRPRDGGGSEFIITFGGGKGGSATY